MITTALCPLTPTGVALPYNPSTLAPPWSRKPIFMIHFQSKQTLPEFGR